MTSSSSSMSSSLVRPMTRSCSSVDSAFHERGRAGTSARGRSSRRRSPDPRRRSAVALRASAPPGFSVPSTKPIRSRLSKNLKPCTSSTTVMAPAIALTSRPASSKQTSRVSALTWNRRSPGVDGALWRGPSSATNGCSSAGLGPENSRSNASEPIEATTDRCLEGHGNRWRAPVPRCRAVRRAPFFAALVDGGDQEDGGRGQRRQHRLRHRIGHIGTLASQVSEIAGQDGNMAASPQGLCEFIDASPSPFHVCVTVAQRLTAAGFTELTEGHAWPRGGAATSPSGPDRWSPGRTADDGGRRSASSAATPTAPTCGSSSIPTGSSPAGRWWRSSPTAARG